VFIIDEAHLLAPDQLEEFVSMAIVKGPLVAVAVSIGGQVCPQVVANEGPHPG
jgi:hypothetical protein